MLAALNMRPVITMMGSLRSAGPARPPHPVQVSTHTRLTVRAQAADQHPHPRRSARHGRRSAYDKKNRRRGRHADQRSPDDTPFRDGNRDRLIGLLTERAAKTLMWYLYETSPPQYQWLLQHYKAHAIPKDGTWDEISGEAFLRGLLSMAAEDAQYQTGREGLFDRAVVCAVDPRNLAQRIMDIRSQLAAEFIQELQAISEENSLLLRETLVESLGSQSADKGTDLVLQPPTLPPAQEATPPPPPPAAPVQAAAPAEAAPVTLAGGDADAAAAAPDAVGGEGAVSAEVLAQLRRALQADAAPERDIGGGDAPAPAPQHPEVAEAAAAAEPPSEAAEAAAAAGARAEAAEAAQAAAPAAVSQDLLAALQRALDASDRLAAASGGAGAHPELQQQTPTPAAAADADAPGSETAAGGAAAATAAPSEGPAEGAEEAPLPPPPGAPRLSANNIVPHNPKPLGGAKPAAPLAADAAADVPGESAA